ncbi:MAG: PEPxxWA-CTERM sorting domain-containing protein [Phenylobacterium sp.]
MTGAAEAATIFSQNFNSGLGANESVGGKFSAGNGVVGHQVAYTNNEYSFYQVRLDLTQATDALLAFDYDIVSEWGYDAFNLAFSTTGVFGPGAMLTPASTDQYYNLSGRAATLMGGKGFSGDQSGRAVYDLSALAGQVVDIRFQFASDYAAYGRGVTFDNLSVTGNVPSAVPEPATWAMMIMGFGLAGTAIRKRRRSLAFG